MYERPKGEVPFPDHCWLKRWHDQHKWFDIRTDEALREIDTKFGTERARMIRNAVVGGMILNFKYFDLMFIIEPMYQDELPYNNELIDKGIYPAWMSS